LSHGQINEEREIYQDGHDENQQKTEPNEWMNL